MSLASQNVVIPVVELIHEGETKRSSSSICAVNTIGELIVLVVFSLQNIIAAATEMGNIKTFH